MKIFCIGLNKTGTVSLHHALELLGFDPVHNAQTNRRLVRQLRSGNTTILDSKDAFTEGEGLFQNWKYLADRFPDDKFILTTRPLKDWINSRIVHVLHLRLSKPEHDWQHLDTRDDEALYKSHHRQVRKHFAKAANFLEIDITANQGWETLCPFLGKDAPDAQFPCANTSQKRITDIATYFGLTLRKSFL